MTFNKEELIKILNYALEKAKESGTSNFQTLESPMIESYSVKIDVLFPENATSSIQVISIAGENNPRISILINDYIEVSPVSLSYEEFEILQNQIKNAISDSSTLEKQRALMAVECTLKDLVKIITE